jgi:bla regulator protein blaR1
MMFINSVWNHLWQSTLFAAMVAMLTLALRKNQAHWRRRLWLAASLKFLVPFSVLAGIGSRLGWRSVRAAPAGLSVLMEQVSQSIAPPVVHQAAIPASSPAVSWPAVLLVLWFCGFAAALVRWWWNWRRVRTAVRAAVSLNEGRESLALRRIERIAGIRRPIHLFSSAGRLEPGVFGVFRTVLLWPAGISDCLADAQLEAIMAHEVCHVRRRDNLGAALHTLVETVFWFHPLVWWLGARLVDEREKACDEEVLRMGSEPEVYAASILKTCQYFLAPPRLSMAGVTGSDLKKRIERIMLRRMGRQLDFRRKLLLAAAGIAAVAGPILFGVASGPAMQAQSQPAAPAAPPAFEVASVKPNSSGDRNTMFQITPGGRFHCSNVSPQMLIIMAYDLKPNQLTGGPNWLDSTKYDITAKAEGPEDPDRLKQMMQTLLADRFKLAFHRETKDLPIYELVTAKNGPKLKASAGDAAQHQQQFFRMGRGSMDMQHVTLANFADHLSRLVGRNVYDRTGIAGTYDIKLEWTPDESESQMFKGPPDGAGPPPPSPDTTGPSLADALQEQLGLRLVAGKGPVEIVVIDHIEKASEN